MEIYGGDSSSFFYLGRYKNIARVIGKVPYYKKIAVHHFFKQLYYRKGSRYISNLIYEFTYEDADSVDWSTANFVWNCYPLNYSVSHTAFQTRRRYFDETDSAFRDPRWRVMLLRKIGKGDDESKPIMSRRYLIPLKTYQSINIKWES